VWIFAAILSLGVAEAAPPAPTQRSIDALINDVAVVPQGEKWPETTFLAVGDLADRKSELTGGQREALASKYNESAKAISSELLPGAAGPYEEVLKPMVKINLALMRVIGPQPEWKDLREALQTRRPVLLEAVEEEEKALARSLPTNTPAVKSAEPIPQSVTTGTVEPHRMNGSSGWSPVWIFVAVLILILILLIALAPRIRQGNLQFPAFGFYLIAGLLAAACLFGALHSSGALKGSVFGVAIELGGAAVIFAIVLWGGLRYEREQMAMRLTFWLQENGVTVPVNGRLTLELDDPIHIVVHDGHATSGSVAAHRKGESCSVHANLDGYELLDRRMVLDDGRPVNLSVRKTTLPASAAGA
jgi:hypothetical protein